MIGGDFAGALKVMLTVIVVVAFVLGVAIASLIWWLI